MGPEDKGLDSWNRVFGAGSSIATLGLQGFSGDNFGIFSGSYSTRARAKDPWIQPSNLPSARSRRDILIPNRVHAFKAGSRGACGSQQIKFAPVSGPATSASTNAFPSKQAQSPSPKTKILQTASSLVKILSRYLSGDYIANFQQRGGDDDSVFAAVGGNKDPCFAKRTDAWKLNPKP